MTVAKGAADVAQAAADEAEEEMNILEARMLALPEGSPENSALEKEFAEKKNEVEKLNNVAVAAHAAVAEAETLSTGKDEDGGRGELDLLPSSGVADTVSLVVALYDYDTVGKHSCLGCVSLSWAELVENSHGQDAHFALQQLPGGGKEIKKLTGTLCIEMVPVDDRSPGAMARAIFDIVDVGGDGELQKTDLAAAIATNRDIAKLLRPCLGLQPLLRPRLWRKTLVDPGTAGDHRDTGIIHWRAFERFCAASEGPVGRARALEVPGGIRLTVKSARGLMKADLLGKSDPYCSVFWRRSRNGEENLGRTATQKNTLNPVWEGEEFELPLGEQVRDRIEHVQLVVKVMDYDTVGKHDCIGCVLLDWHQLLQHCHGGDVHFTLQQPPDGKTIKNLRGTLNLQLGIVKNHSPAAIAREVFDKVDVHGAAMVTKAFLVAEVATRKDIATLVKPSLSLRPLLRPRLWKQSMQDLETGRRGDMVGWQEFEE